MEDSKLKVVRRQKKGHNFNPNRKKPSRESWEKLKEIARQKGWIKKP